MGIDKMFSEKMPFWWQQFVADKDCKITVALETNSELYANYCNRKELIYEQYPRLSKFIDDDIKGENVLMSIDEAKALAELIHIEFDIMEMYQYAYLVLGLVDGYELKDLMIKIMNEERKKNHDDI